MRYRLYIDEVGNSDLNYSNVEQHRFLSLTGVVFELQYVKDVLHPRLEILKNTYFNQHPDDPIILHRKEIMNAKWPFHSLRENSIRANFDKDLYDLIQKLDYIVFTVVIDKKRHIQKYIKWRYDPYHYCLAILLERYVYWLRNNNNHGDVMAESRGGRPDMRLKKSFSNLYEKGTDFISPSLIQEYLTSKNLKVKPKKNNIPGLQFADLIAHPSYKAMCARYERQPLAATFGGRIAAILEKSKYDRSPTGKIDGYGRKWLP